MSRDLPKAPQRASISRTAVWVAAARAIGAREPDRSVRNPDNLAAALLGEPSQLHVNHPIVTALGASYDEAMQDLEADPDQRAMIEERMKTQARQMAYRIAEALPTTLSGGAAGARFRSLPAAKLHLESIYRQ